jgi:hypothetical protein
MRSGSRRSFRARFAFARRRWDLQFYISEHVVPIKPVIQGLAAVWLVLFLASFVSLQVTETDGGPQSGLVRVVAFLTWQLIAFVVATLAAFTTRYAVSRGVERVKAVGYVPLALSVFLVASFIALIGFRFYVAPLFE